MAEAVSAWREQVVTHAKLRVLRPCDVRPKHLELQARPQEVRHEATDHGERPPALLFLSVPLESWLSSSRGRALLSGTGHGDCVLISSQLGGTLARAVWLLVQPSGPEIPPRTEAPQNSRWADFGELCPCGSNVIEATSQTQTGRVSWEGKAIL